MEKMDAADNGGQQLRDVFVSHSSKDGKLAGQVVKILEQMGTTCWVAPRDILSGKQYNQAILDAIKDCSVFLLILSDDSNQSPHVEVEVERAFHYQKTIIPLRIKEVMPSRKLEYFISTAQWVDAFASPLHDRLSHVAAVVKALQMHASMPAIPAEKPSFSGRLRKTLEAAQRNILVVASVTMVLFGVSTFATVKYAANGVSEAQMEAALSDVERQTSNDPRKELAKRGHDWHPIVFYHVATAGDLESTKLFRQAGMHALLDHSQTCMGFGRLMLGYAGPREGEAEIFEEVVQAIGEQTIKACSLNISGPELSSGMFPSQAVQPVKQAMSYYEDAYKKENPEQSWASLDGVAASPLLAAVWLGKPELVKVLIKHGVDQNIGITAMQAQGRQSSVSISPLSEAKRLGNKEIIDILEE